MAKQSGYVWLRHIMQQVRDKVDLLVKSLVFVSLNILGIILHL